MNYYNQKCSRCNKVFTKGDDIVVCPVCGTPQHRECYEEDNKCINIDKHAQNYEWSPSEDTTENEKISEDSDGSVVCSNCGTKNSSDSFFCKHCSAPLNTGNDTKTGSFNFNQGTSSNGMPFGAMPFSSPFDSINDEEEIAENVKQRDAKAYVKTNDLLYSFIFKRIHDFDRSRFNFAAFLFSGGWFLYRKQYGLGIILTLLMGICMVGYDVTYIPFVQFITSNGITTQTELYNTLVYLPYDELLLYSLPSFFKLAQYIIMIVCGFIGNRCYYKHVVKKVQNAKREYTTESEVRKKLDKSGGVDRVLGYILFAGAIILTILPMFY